MAALTPEQLKERQQCEMAGMFRTKNGVVQYYCSILGLDIEEATPKIEAECKMRGISLENVTKEKPKDFWDKADDIMSRGTVIIEKYPIVKEVAAPLLKTAATAGLGALIGAFTGNKAAENQEESDYIDDSSPIMDIGESPSENENDISDGGAEQNTEIKVEEFQTVK